MANIKMASIAIVTELGGYTTSFLINLALLNVFVYFCWLHKTVHVHWQICFQLRYSGRNATIDIASGSHSLFIRIHRNPFYCYMLLIFNISGLVPILQPANLLLLPVHGARINLL